MKKNFRQVILLSFMVILAACSFPYGQYNSVPQDGTPPLVGSIERTATSTPFQPVGATYTPLPAFTPTFGPSPTPFAWDEGLTKPEGQLNVLVLGSDYRPSSGYRTDVILLLAINPDKKTVKAVSFPRDLWVTIPGVGEERINTAQARGGFSLMADTLELNFGVRPDRYVLTNMQGFVSIINSLGGIEVQVSQQLSDTCDLPQASNGYCTVRAGTVSMDGPTALWYVRSRYSTNDFSRTRRAQEVMSALFKKLISLNAITRIPELYELYKQNVDTDLTLGDILTLAPVAASLSEPDHIQQYFIGPEHVTGYVIPSSGANVQLPNQDAIRPIIIEAFFTP